MSVNVENTLAAIDVDIATYWQDILDLEADYLVANGKYAQAVATHDTLPVDGEGSAPENLADSPTDQVEDWDDLVILPNTIDCSLALDVYQTANAWGWVAIFEATINGVTWRKMLDQGSWGRDRVWYADNTDAEDTLLAAAQACWTMNETSGTRYDSISTNHLTDYNTVGYTANGVVGNAAVFDPDNDEHLGVIASLFANDVDFTLCGWFYLDTSTSGHKNQKIFRLLEGTSEKGKCEWENDPHDMKFKLFNKEAKDAVPPTGVVEPEIWHFVECYYDSANGTIGISVDLGDRVESATVSFDEDKIDRLHFGALKTGNEVTVHLDQWCLFDKVITLTERSYLYNKSAGRELE